MNVRKRWSIGIAGLASMGLAFLLTMACGKAMGFQDHFKVEDAFCFLQTNQLCDSDCEDENDSRCTDPQEHSECHEGYIGIDCDQYLHVGCGQLESCLGEVFSLQCPLTDLCEG